MAIYESYYISNLASGAQTIKIIPKYLRQNKTIILNCNGKAFCSRRKEMNRYFHTINQIFFLIVVQQLYIRMSLENQQIFFNQNSLNAEQQPNLCSEDHNFTENQYLNQFLESSPSIILQQNQKQNKKEQRKLEANLMGTGQFGLIEQNPLQSVPKPKRQKSFFHNFQKHLVITLRNIIKLKKCEKKGQLQCMAYQMWSVFANSSIYSKKFLHVLYGVNNEDGQFSKQFLISLGYMELFYKYGQTTIKQVQQFLRKQTIKQLSEISLKNYLSYRKMKRAAQFQKYLYEFIQQLKEGCIRRRLPKQKKQAFLSQVQEQKSGRITE